MRNPIDLDWTRGAPCGGDVSLRDPRLERSGVGERCWAWRRVRALRPGTRIGLQPSSAGGFVVVVFVEVVGNAMVVWYADAPCLVPIDWFVREVA